MVLQKRMLLYKLGSLALIIFGIVSVVVSAFYVSSFLTMFGLGFLFWGMILLYVSPSQHVPITLLNTVGDFSNIERALLEANFKEKGIYLPPKNLKNTDSSLIYIPKYVGKPLPQPEEINEKLFKNGHDGLFLTPPGLLLLNLFEQEIGGSFAKSNLSQLQVSLPKVVENMEIAERVGIRIQRNTVIVALKGSVFDGICKQVQQMPLVHQQIGCTLSSAIACALAKASGRPVMIMDEKRNFHTTMTQIEYLIGEG